jgi:hypothetical protein
MTLGHSGQRWPGKCHQASPVSPGGGPSSRRGLKPARDGGLGAVWRGTRGSGASLEMISREGLTLRHDDVLCLS